MPEVVLVMGCPASGKTTFTKTFPNHFRINRDALGGKLEDLCVHLEVALNEGRDRIVLDNTYKTAASRKGVIECAKRHGATICCFWLTTTADQALINVCMRMLQKYGRILNPAEIKEEGKKDDGIFPPAAIYGYHSKVKGNEPEQPSIAEGFDTVVKVDFERKWPGDWVNLGVILDYDDTLRHILKESDCTTKFPTKPEHIGILPRRREVLLSWREKSYGLYGASNQSGIAKGDLSEDEAKACFQHTNGLLGIDIPFNYCPHQATALACYCRKPAPGLLLSHLWERKLDPEKTIFVGDQTTDKTAAVRLGLTYYHESEFFK